MLPDTQLTDLEFIAFDLETTGLHPAMEEIVEIGAVRFDAQGHILAQFEQLVHPGCPIPADATRVHGIENHHVQHAPTIREALVRFTEFVGERDAVWMAHNAKFDVGFLTFALARNGFTLPTHPVIDTCRLVRRQLGVKWTNLQYLGRLLQISAGEAHRALPDSFLLQRVFCHVIGKSPNLKTLEDLRAVCPPMHFEQFHLTEPEPGYDVLWNAMADHRSVDIQYATGYRPGRFRRVSPRAAVQNKRTVYILAYCHQGRCEKTFRLDRIHSIRDVE